MTTATRHQDERSAYDKRRQDDESVNSERTRVGSSRAAVLIFLLDIATRRWLSPPVSLLRRCSRSVLHRERRLSSAR